MIHASAYHMEVVVEQIRRVVERTAENQGPLLAIRRPQLELKPAAQQPPPPIQVASAPRQAPQPRPVQAAAPVAREAKSEAPRDNAALAEKQAAPAGQKPSAASPGAEKRAEETEGSKPAER